MRTYFHAFVMCQSMFCSIPAPQIWDDKAKDKMLLFLSVVGLEIGSLWALLAWACRVLNLPVLITGLILSAYRCAYKPAYRIVLASIFAKENP